METALRYEIEKAIPELQNEIYPTNAPETAKKPYLVYMRTQTIKIKDLEGYTDKQSLTYVFNVMAKRYSEMTDLRSAIEDLLISFIKKDIGNEEKIFVADLTINNIEEIYEHNLKLNRGIVDFTIHF